ncbi:hypothetical protein HY041_01280, partial [Candidatus Roizmanbacteria bacterium]|nr:hypothetical protein [Candidatus Roizmanbacteria bacterium]
MNKGTNNLFYIIIAASILILYLILQPKITSKLFGMKKSPLLDAFVQKTLKEKRVDVQEFWRMREFYCPGSFVFDKTKNPFLSYQCNWLKSEDYLVSERKLGSLKNNTIFEDETTQIYQENDRLIIRFVVSSDEMKKAIGYFDYNEKDKDLVKDKYWMDITTITLHK